MKLKLLLLSLLVSFSCLGNTKSYTNLPTAIEKSLVQIKANSEGGLRDHNFVIKITNLQRDTSYIRIPPGLHFKSGNAGAQDLLTVSEVLLVVAPRKQVTVKIQGFCMQASNFLPPVGGVYLLAGLAEPNLKGLADRLYLHEKLTEHYAQMFVWAITDNRSMYPLTVDSSSVDVAKMIVEYVASITKQPVVSVGIGATNIASPPLEVFSKKGVLAFHNPIDQVASFILYDAEGNELSIFYINRKISRGLKVHEFSMNDMIPAGTDPVYHVKVINSSGEVLAQMQVDRNTEPREVKTEVINFNFDYKLDKPVKEARIKIYLQDGTLIEEFKRYINLTPGNYRVAMHFMHFYPADTKFVAKLVSPDGQIHKEQLVSLEN